MSIKHFLFALVLSFSSLAVFAQEEQKIEITANDMMQYDKKAFEVTTGQKVTITLKNIGKLPKVAMGHNMVILKAGTVVPTFAMKGMTAAATGYIPQDDDSKKTMIAHSELTGAGESSTFSFTAPEPGSYPYLCTFPGHFALMQGVMTVKAK
jgi:azurin